MSKPFKFEDYHFEDGRWMVTKSRNWVRNKNTLNRLYQITKKRNIPRRVPSATPKASQLPAQSQDILKRYGKYFSPSVEKRLSQSWAKNMTLRGGKNPEYGFKRAKYFSEKGKNFALRDSPSRKWGAEINSSKASAGTTLNGSKEWARHLLIACHYVGVQAANFRVLVGQRALRVFQDSFRHQRFYSQGEHHWQPLADYTKNKRIKRGKPAGPILKEYGDLYESIKDKEVGASTVIYTDIVKADDTKHKKHSICYAGYHNEGEGTYGSSKPWHKAKPYVQRQFMGHSTHLDPMIDPFLRKMMKLYLFDSVFLAKKV